MTYTTTMTSKGQITVPVAIRKKLGLKPGEQIAINLKGNTATIEAYDWRAGMVDIQRRMQSHLKKQGITPLSDEELDAAINDAAQAAAWERYQRSLKD